MNKYHIIFNINTFKSKATRRLTIARKGEVRDFNIPEDKARGIISILKEFEVPTSGRKEVEKIFPISMKNLQNLVLF